MNPILSTALRFKWRCISYFGATALPAFTAVIMAAEQTTAKVWIIAIASGLGAGFGTLKALFDQSVEFAPAAPPSV